MALRFPIRWAAAACVGLTAIAGAADPARAATPISAVAETPDQKLADVIAVHLAGSTNLKGYEIEVVCDNGLVELSGTVKGAEQKAEVVRIVHGIRGVKHVTDKLTVGADIQPAQALDSLPTPQFNNSPQGLPPGVMIGAPKNMPPVSGPGYVGNGSPPVYNAGPIGHGGHGGSMYNGGPIGNGGPAYNTGPVGPGSGPSYATGPVGTDPSPIGVPPTGGLYDAAPPKMPPYAWPTYAPYNNFSRVGYPTEYPAEAFPFIGPFYPFPKVPPGWRAIKLEWEDGAWYYGRTATKRDWWKIRYW